MPILQIRKLRQRGVKELVDSPTASGWLEQDRLDLEHQIRVPSTTTRTLDN